MILFGQAPGSLPISDWIICVLCNLIGAEFISKPLMLVTRLCHGTSVTGFRRSLIEIVYFCWFAKSNAGNSYVGLKHLD